MTTGIQKKAFGAARASGNAAKAASDTDDAPVGGGTDDTPRMAPKGPAGPLALADLATATITSGLPQTYDSKKPTQGHFINLDVNGRRPSFKLIDAVNKTTGMGQYVRAPFDPKRYDVDKPAGWAFQLTPAMVENYKAFEDRVKDQMVENRETWAPKSKASDEDLRTTSKEGNTGKFKSKLNEQEGYQPFLRVEISDKFPPKIMCRKLIDGNKMTAAKEGSVADLTRGVACVPTIRSAGGVWYVPATGWGMRLELAEVLVWSNLTEERASTIDVSGMEEVADPDEGKDDKHASMALTYDASQLAYDDGLPAEVGAG